MNLASDQAVSRVLAAQLGFSYIELADVLPDPLAIASIPESLASECGCIGVRRVGGVLTVAMCDPLRFSVVARIEAASDCHVKQVVASRMDIVDAIARVYAAKPDAARVSDVPDPESRGETLQPASPPDGLGVEDVGSGLVDFVVGAAVERRASEIHIESIENDVVVRYRMGSALSETMRLPPGARATLVDRLKLMAGLQVEERRLPQAGRVRVQLDSVQLDLRLSTVRTQKGERLVLRLANPRMRPPALGGLGLSRAGLAGLQSLVERRRGVIAVVGPPGSGRSTTLNSIAAALTSSGRTAVVLETPTAAALAAAVRQRPDVVLIGDVEDQQIALAAAEVARRGPLLLAAIEGSDVASAVSAFVSLGVEPKRIAGVMVGVVAQQLVRRLCERCRRPEVPPADVLEALNVSAADPHSAYRPIGCDACDYTGFRGRTGLFEVVEVGDDLRRIIARRAPEDEIRSAVRRRGTPSLVDEGLAAVTAGTTTADQVIRGVQMTRVPRPLCVGCGLAIESDYVACPRCGARQHPPCRHCGRALQPGWRVCPYCEHASPPVG